MIEKFIASLKEQGMTQNEIADRTGLKQSFISQLSNGKKPSLDTVLKFAKAFGVTTDTVLGLDQPTFTDCNSIQDRIKPRTRSISRF